VVQIALSAFCLGLFYTGGNSMNSNKKEETTLVHLPSEDRKKAMQTHPKNDRNLLLMWTWRGTKFFLLTLVGFAIAFVFSHTLGAVSLAQTLLSVAVGTWVLRGAVSLFCLFAIGMIFESWR
jgi:hypothetical protein